MRKIIILISIIIFLIFFIIVPKDNNNLINLSDNEKQELMKVLKIENSSSFLPLSIKKEFLEIGDISDCYVLKFQISKEDYKSNELKYKDIDTGEISLNWKEIKDKDTYICYVRELENNEYRKELFEKFKELKNNY